MMQEIAKGLLKLAGKSAVLLAKNEHFRRSANEDIKFFSNCSTKMSDGVMWNQGRVSITPTRVILKAGSAALGVLGKGLHLDEKLSDVSISAKKIKAGVLTHNGVSITHAGSEYLLIGLKARDLLTAIG
jgi:hypothetical protein